jgi:hypothetical protein
LPSQINIFPLKVRFGTPCISSAKKKKKKKNYMKVRPDGPGPLFRHFNLSPLTRYQFTGVLSKAIKYLQLPGSSEYKSHSFRIGASTDLAIRGFSDEDIQRSGRWKSSCFKSYIRVPKF